MNVLYIDPRVHSSYSEMYHIYNGLYDEFSKISNCFLYQDKVVDIKKIIKLCPFRPDIIYFGLGWFAGKNFCKIINTENIKIPIVCYIYKPQNFINKKLNFCKINNAKLIVTSLPDYKNYEKITGIHSERFFQSGDNNIFIDRNLDKIYHVGCSGALHNSTHYPIGAFKTKNLRFRIQEILKKQKKLNNFLNFSDSIKPRILDYNDYSKKVSQSKIWISTLAPFGEIPPRFFEIGMSKTLIFTDPIPAPYRDLFYDGYNCIEFQDDLSDFLIKLNYYLNNWIESKRIINNAYNDFHNNHTWKNRAELLFKLFEDCIKKNRG